MTSVTAAMSRRALYTARALVQCRGELLGRQLLDQSQELLGEEPQRPSVVRAEALDRAQVGKQATKRLEGAADVDELDLASGVLLPHRPECDSPGLVGGGMALLSSVESLLTVEAGVFQALVHGGAQQLRSPLGP